MPPPVDAAQQARLARQGAALHAALDRMQAFGHTDEFASALRGLEIEGLWAEAPSGWVFGAYLRHLRQIGATNPDRSPERAAPGEDPVDCVVDFARQLAAHGIDLLFVPVPARVQIYPEDLLELPSFTGFAGFSAPLCRCLLDLQQRGVESLDLTAVFVPERHLPEGPEGSDLYLRFNTHWSSRGAEVAARALADHVSGLGWFTPGPEPGPGELKVVESVVPMQQEPAERPPGTGAEPMLLRQVLGRPTTWAPARRSPVLVIGDSFVDFLSWRQSSVIDHLERFLRRPVDAISNPGGGPDQCRKSLRRRDDDLAGKRLVIWLIAASAIRSGERWTPLPMFRR